MRGQRSRRFSARRNSPADLAREKRSGSPCDSTVTPAVGTLVALSGSGHRAAAELLRTPGLAWSAGRMTPDRACRCERDTRIAVRGFDQCVTRPEEPHAGRLMDVPGLRRLYARSPVQTAASGDAGESGGTSR